jgi:hypothetical protein
MLSVASAPTVTADVNCTLVVKSNGSGSTRAATRTPSSGSSSIAGIACTAPGAGPCGMRSPGHLRQGAVLVRVRRVRLGQPAMVHSELGG